MKPTERTLEVFITDLVKVQRDHCRTSAHATYAVNKNFARADPFANCRLNDLQHLRRNGVPVT